MRLTYVEHACVLLEGSRRVLIDPYVLNRTLPADPDLVVVTHGHKDHLGEALRLARPTVTTNEIAKELSRRGLPAEGITRAAGSGRRRRVT
jgi:L-ascorbate metabolism protein UlaG (beta-lactamase superfamily)